jgi:hypothetical protein
VTPALSILFTAKFPFGEHHKWAVTQSELLTEVEWNDVKKTAGDESNVAWDTAFVLPLGVRQALASQLASKYGFGDVWEAALALSDSDIEEMARLVNVSNASKHSVVKLASDISHLKVDCTTASSSTTTATSSSIASSTSASSSSATTSSPFVRRWLLTQSDVLDLVPLPVPTRDHGYESHPIGAARFLLDSIARVDRLVRLMCRATTRIHVERLLDQALLLDKVQSNLTDDEKNTDFEDNDAVEKLVAAKIERLQRSATTLFDCLLALANLRALRSIAGASTLFGDVDDDDEKQRLLKLCGLTK